MLSYNSDNQLVGPTYDGQGNPTLYNWGGTNTAFAWDAEDRLVSFGTAFTAGYRPDGLRAWKQTGIASTRHYFLYDGGHVLAELDSNGNLLSAYGWGAAGLSERYEKATGLVFAYTFDPSCNLLQRHTNNLDNGGTPIYADYSTLYDAFGGQRGAVTSRSGYALVNQDPVGWGGQFGGYTDQETVTPPAAGSDPLPRKPLVLLGHRYYDPGAGRFLNRDPGGMEGGVNVYAYAVNNPVNLVDPLGLDFLAFSKWFDGFFLNGAAEHYGDVQGRYDAGQASGRELVWAAMSAGGQTILLATSVVDGYAFVRGGVKFVASRAAMKAAGGLAVKGGLGVAVKAGISTGIKGFRPFAKSAALNRRVIEQMFRGKWIKGAWESIDEIGGGLAGAIRREKATGLLTKGVSHIPKGEDRLAQLKSILQYGKIGEEVLSPSDLSIVRKLHDDLQRALQGKKGL